MAGVNATTGRLLDGFEHAVQSLNKIISTPQGARIMREWCGNPGLKLLGENMTEETILLWFNTLYMLIELFEPRFRVLGFQVDDLDRLGFADFQVDVEFRPFAHFDWQQAALFVSLKDGQVSLRSAL